MNLNAVSLLQCISASALFACASAAAQSCAGAASPSLCDQAVWSLPASQKTLIASLETEATYKVCLNAHAQSPVALMVDDRPVAIGGSRSALYAVTQAVSGGGTMHLGGGCILVTGRHITIESARGADKKPAWGTYARLEMTNPLTSYGRFGLETNLPQEPYAPNANTMVAYNTQRKLYRLCFDQAYDARGQTIDPSKGLSKGARRIQADNSLLSMYQSSFVAATFGDYSCVDVSAKNLSVLAGAEGTRDVVSGTLLH